MPILPKVGVSVYCECVRYMREVLGVNIKGDAGTHEPNITFLDLQYGDVVIMQYDVPHEGMYVSQNNDGILIKESNFRKCKESTRRISFNEAVGFYRPDVVE